MSDAPPPQRRTPLPLRLLAVVGAGLLLLALVVAISRDRNPVEQESGTSAAPAAPPGPTTSASPTADQAGASAPDVVPDLATLEDPDVAEAAGAAVVLASARRAATDDWRELTDPAWHDRLDEPRPAYVGTVELGEDRSRVDGSLVIALPSDGLATLPLRFVAAATVLQDAGSAPSVTARVDGVDATVELDADAALLTVTGYEAVPVGQAQLVRLDFSYRVPDRASIVDDGGPAGFGLLARSATATMLGHGLPVLTFDDSPMVPWGDVGAFPTAFWSVHVRGPGVLATGANEAPCAGDDAAASCVWARGPLLRDLAIAAFDPGAVRSPGGDGSTIVTARPGASTGVEAVLREAVEADRILTDRLGPLPWTEVEVVLVPLRSAAGMEFPGLVIVDPEYLDRLDGGFGTFVVVHEVAHQWFHALVGNSSLLDPVVDESLAQYLSLWYYREVHGEAAARGVVDRYLEGRYDRAAANGIADVAPGSALAAFGSSGVYGPMAYARAPFAWLVAEAELGEAAIEEFLAEVVRTHGLGVVTAADLRDLAAAGAAPGLAAALDRWWFDPRPANDEVP